MKRISTVSHLLILFSFFFLLLLISCKDNPTQPANSPTNNETYTFVSKLYNTGSGDGQFELPCGIAFDQLNNLFICDYQNHRIVKYDSAMIFIKNFGNNGSDSGQFKYPNSICIDKLNNIYVGDSQNHRIQKFDNDGNYILKWNLDSSAYPYSLAIDNIQEFLYIGCVEYINSNSDINIQKYNLDGKYISKIGSSGINDNQFRGQISLSIDKNKNIYVFDYNGSCIKIFDANGSFIKQFGSYGSSNGEFSKEGLGGAVSYNLITLDKFNNIYVCDIGNYRIQKFDNNGIFITKWGSRGYNDGLFEYALSGIAIDNNNNVLVADAGTYRIQKFSKQ